MQQTSILYIGTNNDITATVSRLLNARENWCGVCVDSTDKAKAAFNERLFDIVLIGNGLKNEEESALKNHIESFYPTTKVVTHYGGGSGLLYNEIITALQS